MSVSSISAAGTAVKFGLITVVNPLVREQLAQELHSPKGHRLLDGISLLANDPQITRPNLLGPWDASGIWPEIDHQAQGGLFELPDGRGVIVTNIRGHKRGMVEGRRPASLDAGDDMNHLIRAHKGRPGEFSEPVVQQFLQNEEALAASGAKPPIRRLTVLA